MAFLGTFWYSCWESNQSFVFTLGWKQFVKARRLERGESISFYRCETVESAFLLIDVDRGDREKDTTAGNMQERINVGGNNDNGMNVDDEGKEAAEKSVCALWC